ncbi:MAG: AEC family transporter [Lachnospiraceae bacterium]|nr:AEC family transporter [Lachnospiraceae bacterium]
MDTLFIMLRNVILFVLLAVPGILLVKTKLIKEEQSGILSRLLLYVGMPFLIFSGTVDKIRFTSEFFLELLFVFLAGIAYTFLMVLLSRLFTAGEKDPKKNGMMRFAAVFSNNGFLGIPLAMAVFGADSPIMTVLIVLNIVTNVLLNTLGVYLVSRDPKEMNLKKAFLHPVFIAFLIGILVNLLNLKSYLPEISTYATHFSNIVTPVSMTVLGIKLCSVPIKKLFTTGKMFFIAALRLVLFPVLITGILLLLRVLLPWQFLDSDLILGFFMAFAMPTAGLASTLADRYHGDTEGAAVYTLGSTILSVLTIPLLYWGLTAILAL